MGNIDVNYDSDNESSASPDDNHNTAAIERPAQSKDAPLLKAVLSHRDYKQEAKEIPKTVKIESDESPENTNSVTTKKVVTNDKELASSDKFSNQPAKSSPSDMLKDFLRDDEDQTPFFDKPAPAPPNKTIEESKEDLKVIKQATESLAIAMIRLLRRIWGLVLKYIPKFVETISVSFRNYPKQATIITMILLAPMFIFAFTLLQSGDQQQKNEEVEGKTLPASFVKQSQQTVYYPANLPVGFRINANESINDSTLTSYSITNGDIVIAFSQQANIPESAFNSLFAIAENLETANGTARLKRLDNGSVAAGLRIGESTILLNTSVDIESELLKIIFDSIKPARN